MPRSCRASNEGLKKAEKAFKLKGCTQEYLAGAVGCTRQTVIKFFARRPVAKHLFQAMCIELNLEWGEIAELEPEEAQSSRNLGMDTERGKTSEVVQEERITAQVLTSPVSLVEKQNANSKEQLVITFTGDIESLQKNPAFQAAFLSMMQAVSGDTSLKIEKIEKGSIKITFSGSPEGLKRLEEQITSGNLTEVLGMPVENVQLLPSGTTDEEQDKIRLVQEIIAQGASGRDLSDADLSSVDLRGTDLSCADLRGADLRNANLEGADLNCADLRGADLRNANLNRVSLHDAVIDEATIISNKWRLVWEIVNQASKGRSLSGADLIGANLSLADLIGANLSLTDLSGADLIGANLSLADLIGANLSLADLIGANLSGANLSLANLSGANLSLANLSRADLSRADLRRAVIDQATIISSKWRLVWEIVNQPSKGRSLSSADLSNANLIDANLIDANLINANLIDANLINANLRGADLINANLINANLRGADLSRADLRSAIVKNARFGRNLGLTEDMKRDLIWRGAIFEDSPPGDRSGILTFR